MRELALMRHGKSAWGRSDQSDHERPLEPRGEKGALTMAEVLKKRSWTPGLVICSDAQRTQATAEQLKAVFSELTIQMAPELYLGSVHELGRVLGRCSGTLDRVLILGHNPGLEECVFHLSGSELRLRTADVVLLRTERSADLGWGALVRESRTFTLVEHLVCRELLPQAKDVSTATCVA